ncbi:C-GCAxxG-C-C family protein [Anaeropeptidivorans aminofermentans]|jgi:C_GCAxxG_C_C family probable redox protein|uniref:C-GCAxxG-C-C family protein n=1 Tax=Anaeropeptidivorans aminofermentans TaxID=2934315 RepID=UPI000EDA2FE3|nr:C-GCAxxG-C-C family protein [Anaeropeptidivorans aminofermentans]MBE6012252.1 C_GCAxxG_C_C family protein [Lachnospiraceae bacterium]HAQ41864.1 hypothetical protein [Clostridiales bacterium]
MDKNEINTLFSKGMDCSQIVLMEMAEKIRCSSFECAKIASAFGGGMGIGDTCGAVTGALMALGIKYGNGRQEDFSSKEILRKKVERFHTEFLNKHKSLICRELTGYDFSKKGEFEKAVKIRIIEEKCPHYVLSALEILNEIL